MPPPTVSGNEDLAGDLLDHMHHGFAVVGTGGDVEKGDFVRALLVVAAGDFHRIAGIADFDELDALDHPATIHVQTGNDAFGQPHQPVSAASAICWAAARSMRHRTAPGR
jgi:hypothetical protein